MEQVDFIFILDFSPQNTDLQMSIQVHTFSRISWDNTSEKEQLPEDMISEKFSSSNGIY